MFVRNRACPQSRKLGFGFTAKYLASSKHGRERKKGRILLPDRLLHTVCLLVTTIFGRAGFCTGQWPIKWPFRPLLDAMGPIHMDVESVFDLHEL
jgi:hypothetical protein